jgi:hypothetical protein
MRGYLSFEKPELFENAVRGERLQQPLAALASAAFSSITLRFANKLA